MIMFMFMLETNVYLGNKYVEMFKFSRFSAFYLRQLEIGFPRKMLLRYEVSWD